MIALYTQPGCIHCDHAKTHLNLLEVEFEEINIHEHADALQFLKDNGHTTVPQLYRDTLLLAPGGNVRIQELTKQQLNEWSQ